MRRIKKTAEFLLEKGLIFEINRKVLHPLGLALEVIEDDDGKVAIGGLWDCRDDPEGIIFTPDSWEEGKRKIDKYMEDYGNRALETRQEKVGFVIQEKKTK